MKDYCTQRHPSRFWPTKSNVCVGYVWVDMESIQVPEYITMMMHLPAGSTSHTECTTFVFLCDTEREKDNKKGNCWHPSGQCVYPVGGYQLKVVHFLVAFPHS